jgi:hypothetical protein
MEHRRRLEHDGAAREEPERRPAEDRASRKEQSAEGEHQRAGAEREQRVQEQGPALGLVEVDQRAELGRDPGEEIEAGWRVGGPAGRDASALPERTCVGEMLGRVEAADRRVLERIPERDGAQ